jgi:hypothetical protein
MIEISSLVALTCGFGGLAVALLLFGLTKRNRRYLYAAGVSLALGSSLAGWTIYRTLHKAYDHVAAAIRPRTGEEIYTALFGSALPGCRQIIDYQDQVVPKIDYAIWLKYRTCPQELKRVLAQYPYAREVVASASPLPMVPNGEEVAWFRPKLLGDTVIVYEYTTLNGRNSRRFWTSLDSTNVFYQDILD